MKRKTNTQGPSTAATTRVIQKKSIKIGKNYQADIPPHQGHNTGLDAFCRGRQPLNVPKTTKQPFTRQDLQEFTLGLYLYDKNFTRIRRFMSTSHEVSYLQSFYHQTFKGTGAHKKFKEWRKSVYKEEDEKIDEDKNYDFKPLRFSHESVAIHLNCIVENLCALAQSKEAKEVLKDAADAFSAKKISLETMIDSFLKAVTMEVLLKVITPNLLEKKVKVVINKSAESSSSISREKAKESNGIVKESKRRVKEKKEREVVSTHSKTRAIKTPSRYLD